MTRKAVATTLYGQSLLTLADIPYIVGYTETVSLAHLRNQFRELYDNLLTQHETETGGVSDSFLAVWDAVRTILQNMRVPGAKDGSDLLKYRFQVAKDPIGSINKLYLILHSAKFIQADKVSPTVLAFKDAVVEYVQAAPINSAVTEHYSKMFPRDGEVDPELLAFSKISPALSAVRQAARSGFDSNVVRLAFTSAATNKYVVPLRTMLNPKIIRGTNDPTLAYPTWTESVNVGEYLPAYGTLVKYVTYGDPSVTEAWSVTGDPLRLGLTDGAKIVRESMVASYLVLGNPFHIRPQIMDDERILREFSRRCEELKLIK